MRELILRALLEPERPTGSRSRLGRPISRAAVSHAAALRRARGERAARQAGTAAAVPQSPQLRTTA
ncbi:hypothetical protein [Streptomyces sp. MNP-20]|uniref:hypothetical protein n=1 Tax=Streptomyces sp. MNP-20 TaxID=2721165 RepID=UPI001C1DFDBC|nr:hypothetical protein [Streptomyces sp. MNP-20]